MEVWQRDDGEWVNSCDDCNYTIELGIQGTEPRFCQNIPTVFEGDVCPECDNWERIEAKGHYRNGLELVADELLICLFCHWRCRV
jgi:hypothetical protein